MAAILLAVAFVSSGCDTLSSDGQVDGQGQVRLLLTDAPFPFDLVQEARVTITSVELVRVDGEAAGEVIVLSDEDQSFNLLDLQDGVTAEIGEDLIPAGVYSHARLSVSDAAVIMKDGTEYNLKVPSGRIKVLLPDFEVDEDGITEATLDFDVENSFVTRGNIHAPGFKGFIFKPVVKTIRVSIDDEDRNIDVDFDEDLEVKGAIEALTATSITVNGLAIQITSETEFDGIADLAALLLGDYVEVEYRITEEGEAVATRIERRDEDELDDLFEIEGFITAVTENSITVNGITFALTGDTEIGDDLDAEGLSIGSRVEIHYRIAEGGGLEATRVEKDPDAV